MGSLEGFRDSLLNFVPITQRILRARLGTASRLSGIYCWKYRYATADENASAVCTTWKGEMT